MKGYEYWVVRVNGGWLVGSGRSVTPNKDERFHYNRGSAYVNAGEWADARVVHVTRKPKRPPPLAVGDEVIVKAKVLEVWENGSGVLVGSKTHKFWLGLGECERVKE